MKRELKGKWAIAANLIALGYALFHLYTGAVGVLPHMQQRAIHVLFGFILIFMLYQARGGKIAERRIPIWDLAFCALTVIGCLNIYFTYAQALEVRGEPSTTYDLVLGTIMTIVALEASRRSQGWLFPGLIIAMIAYAFLGKYIPGSWGHTGFNFNYVISTIYRYDSGLWGFLTGVSASLVVMFILFGAVLQYTGGGETFIDLAITIAGRWRGGPAQVAVVSSGLFGSISGSAVANVATTGSFTIPLMKKLGYKPDFASGVEATASTGGQLMPPVMASGAFIMAEFLAIPYLSICVAAAIPACLYYLSVIWQVYLEARKYNLPPMPNEQIPKITTVLTWTRLAPFIFPFGLLIYFLFIGYTPYTACFYAIMTSVVLYFFGEFKIVGMKNRLCNIVNALEIGGKSMTDLVAIITSVNIFVGLMFLTGLSGKIGAFLIILGETSLTLALLVAAVFTILLGMGMPTVASYILGVSIIAPTLITLGIAPLAAHLFIFYYSILSAITPPICAACFVGALIADTKWLGTAKVALRLGTVGFFMPFIIILTPSIMLKGSIANIALAVIASVLGIVFMGMGFVGYVRKKMAIVTRILSCIGGLCLFFPSSKVRLLSIALIATGFLLPLLFHSQKKGGDSLRLKN
jgi:TRAP transporter 4TM/12TM fusion protein